MRLFTALDMPPSALAAFIAAEASLKERILGRRWQRSENAHLTLQFLGEAPEQALPGLKRELRDACAAISPFDLALGNLGTFGGRRARVLWLGIDGDVEALRALEIATREAIIRLGHALETRRYSPHITLCRELEQPVDLAELESEVAIERVAWGVETAVLYHSDLTPQGPCYTALERFPLGAR
ncbi:MAG TPA: RNA 2',3'-cyclic phosphodiesterase [Oscillatoriaceae cyanobacterium]